MDKGKRFDTIDEYLGQCRNEFNQLICIDCDMPSSEFEQLNVDEVIWLKISPVINGCGVLCPTCTLNRIKNLPDFEDCIFKLNVWNMWNH